MFDVSKLVGANYLVVTPCLAGNLHHWLLAQLICLKYFALLCCSWTAGDWLNRFLLGALTHFSEVIDVLLPNIASNLHNITKWSISFSDCSRDSDWE